VSVLRTRPLFAATAAACLVAVLVEAAPARADIYQYVGKDGVIHISNTKKKGKLVIRQSETKLEPNRKVVPAALPSDRFTRYDEHILEAARLYQIPEALIRAVIHVESNFDSRAVSHANAQGLMQLIPGTAERMLVSDVFDVRQNILGGTRYLRVLANLFNGSLQLTLAAYNAGEGAVIKYGGIPPYDETQKYVSKVLSFYNFYRSQDATVAAR
jgi:soluble lytic murein transglycosylase-like protein